MSDRFPKAAGQLKKGDHIVMKDKFPCKIQTLSVSKTGKHGHAKVAIMALDIFTNRKYEDAQPSTHNVWCPFVERVDYEVVNIEDDWIEAMAITEGTEDRQIRLPADEKMAEEITEFFEAGERSVIVNIVSALGQDHVMGYRTESM
eukprot:gnl/Dysnectes_brevis/333_a368_11808.p1 GENE.gnl/Dysnectes_brevis/333_a368_11808~~gnl/Dysnectes_brevis/333_a368_11808.p1  ORF type:complete len:146 (+),score=35.24 gnl/Dysnectes_brevis/333_a368_11808:30-467(+)